MPAVKIVAEWSKEENDLRMESTLEFVAAIDLKGHIKPEQRVFGLITGYDYGSLPPGDYPFTGKESDQELLKMDWGRDYQKFNSTINVLGRRLKPGDIITHVEKPGIENTYDYKILFVTYF
ncbi:hypothetical protein F3J30_01610 [Enterobacter sp. Tr-810]|uniref:hypothetical protein n=1 Tax=Enterobacter sp. Tr-810 TaxID=2608347 RepID=UPI0014195282|nr:hypothetical protein [Enterobacter sp. Tr-810]NIF35237.1 hypothetical protein [Enterobacter sp. Tr-810]